MLKETENPGSIGTRLRIDFIATIVLPLAKKRQQKYFMEHIQNLSVSVNLALDAKSSFS